MSRIPWPYEYTMSSCAFRVCGSANDDVSVGSIDEMLSGDAMEKIPDAWQAELADRMEEILARKGSTVLGREKCYKTYVHLLTAQYVEEEIRGKEPELVAAFLKSIKEEKSEKETILALKGRPHTSSVCKFHPIDDLLQLWLLLSSRLLPT